MRFGVLQFPGSCDDRDALQACLRVGDAELLWHQDRDLRGADAIVVAGTRAKYVEAYELITGEPFDAWIARTAA